MKNFLFILAAAALFSACSNPKTNETVTTEHLYKPSYADNFKIGDAKNALLVEKMHEAMIAKKFDEAASYLADSVVFYLGDGTTLKGKPAILDLMKKQYSQINIKNYDVQVNLPVVSGNGEEWVLLWDNADIETPDGKTSKGFWMEGFQFKDGKVVGMNQFEKTEVVK
jgi:hypothetical protein